MDISFSGGVRIAKFGASARKVLRERLDPTSEPSTKIEKDFRSIHELNSRGLGRFHSYSEVDEKNSNGKTSRESEYDNSDDEQNSSKKVRLIKKKLPYSNGEPSPQALVHDGKTVAYSARTAGHRRVKQATKWKAWILNQWGRS